MAGAGAIERGNNLDVNKYGMMDASTAMTSVLAPRRPGDTKMFLHKVRTPMVEVENAARGQQPSGDEPSNAALAGALDERGRLMSVSTAVTRAIGDWDGSRALVPHPEILRFRVPADGCHRAVLASDGLWDFVTPTEAAELALCRAADADGAASKLLALAVERSNRKYNQLKDDLTVLVVDLNPSGAPPPRLVPKAGGGCCAIS